MVWFLLFRSLFFNGGGVGGGVWVSSSLWLIAIGGPASTSTSARGGGGSVSIFTLVIVAGESGLTSSTPGRGGGGEAGMISLCAATGGGSKGGMISLCAATGGGSKGGAAPVSARPPGGPRGAGAPVSARVVDVLAEMGGIQPQMPSVGRRQAQPWQQRRCLPNTPRPVRPRSVGGHVGPIAFLSY